MPEFSLHAKEQIRSTLETLAEAELPKSTWDKVPAQLRNLEHAVAAGAQQQALGALAPLGRAAFEAKVGPRSATLKRSHTNLVVPTKQTPALPIIGAICGAILLFLAWQLGGGLIFIGTAILSAAILVIAVLGTKTASEKIGAIGTTSEVDASPDVMPAPTAVRDSIEKIAYIFTV